MRPIPINELLKKQREYNKPNSPKPDPPRSKEPSITSRSQKSNTEEPLRIDISILKQLKEIERLSKKLEEARILANIQRSKSCTQGYKEYCLERLIKLLNE